MASASAVEPDYITFCPLTTLDDLTKTLDEYGVAVLPNVITEQECDDLRKKMFDYLAKEFQVVEPDDYEKLKPLRGMMLKSYGIALRPEILELKTDERVINAFRRIWNEQDLSTSFDAITIGPPPEKRAKKGFFDIQNTWFHTDQSSHKQGLHCVQSYINLEEAAEGDGCLSALLNSHKHHESFFRHFKMDTKGRDWFLLNKTNHHDWYTKEKGCQWAMISAPKGSMVFWDSRTIHMGTAPRMGRPNPDRWRFIAYVCYTPARLQSAADSKRKEFAFVNNLTTAHWPYSVKLCYDPLGDLPPNKLSQLSERQRKLFGI